ncbi:MAG TPA: right-handed parallel beta-helix repeat-containing protein [Candidatus Binatia bacterium]|nr:right-handed parallel beta-helix repeat-containing protein [Candidatus Binatia bacterium]
MNDRDAMNRRTLLSALVLLTASVIWAPRALAFPSYDDGTAQHNGCVSCHDYFSGSPNLHSSHLTKFNIINTGACTLCHQTAGGDGLPVLTYWSGEGFGCAGCHGNDYGETSVLSGLPKASGYGLRRKHALLGVTVCATCHFPGSAETGEPDPPPLIFPEPVPPPYYGQPTNNLTNPCSTAQESFDNTVGLDNDGNGYADMADSACQAFASTTTTIVSTTTTTTTLPTGPRMLRLYPGQSIQDAVDAIAPGGRIYVMPGTYQETHGRPNAVTVSKSGIQLIGRSKPKAGLRVILQAYPGQRNGIVVEPAVPNTRIEGFRLRGFTVQGFPNNGILTRYVDSFRIERNESIDNLENGIWPTLSANGLVKKNVAYGSEDSALWVEASENIRVIANELHHSPTGLEITVSHNVLAQGNDIHDNTVGVGLYHPNAASLPPLEPLENNGDWTLLGNHVHDNNQANGAPPGTMSAQLPPGGGIAVLGVHDVNILDNRVENNDFFGTAVVDWCLATGGTPFNCTDNPPLADPVPRNNAYVSNALSNNGLHPIPFGGLEAFAADITYLVLAPDAGNCFAHNTYGTLTYVVPPLLAKRCP